MLRLPRSLLDPETASRYCVDEEAFSMLLTREHVILTFDSETEYSEDWDEGEGWLSTLVPLRGDIAAGDLRGLYLGWLLCVQEEVLHSAMIEPRLPPGLGNLSGSLQALVDWHYLGGAGLSVVRLVSRRCAQPGRVPKGSEISI